MNPNQKKNLIYSVVLITLVGLVYVYRNFIAEQPPQEFYLQGPALGSTYNIKYIDPKGRNLQREVDSLIVDFNTSLSTYQPDSDISNFNKSDSVHFRFSYFYEVLEGSKQVYQRSGGAFDPTVMPLVKAWGFGPDKTPIALDSAKLDSLRGLVDFESIRYTESYAVKTRPGIQLDFNAIAGGYVVDVVAKYFEQLGIDNFMAEIGGEVVCRGKNAAGGVWVIGINNPTYEEKGGEFLSAKVQLADRALATSGNYNNYYIKDGKKYAHTIDPKKGYPVEHNLLSATVVAPDCMTADGLATAFMVMGVERSKDFLAKNPDIQALLIYDEQGSLKTFETEALKTWLVE